MKKVFVLLFISFILAMGLLATQGGGEVESSRLLGVTNTPSADTPTPLPTDQLPTAEPTQLPTATPAPTQSPVTPDPPTPTPVTAGAQPADPTPTLPALPAMGNGAPAPAAAKTIPPLARLVIPGLGVDVGVMAAPRTTTGWDITNLGFRVGWLEGTTWPDSTLAAPPIPGLPVSNTALAGHLNLNGADGPFARLGKLLPGAQIVLITQQARFTYRVKNIAVTPMSDSSVLAPGDRDILTLITCDPGSWDAAAAAYTARLVVTAERVKVEVK